jgi:hypothetical protein
MSMVVGFVSFYFSSQICCKKMRNHDQSWFISSLCLGEGKLLGFECRVSHLPGRCSITWTRAPVLFAFSYFWDFVILPRADLGLQSFYLCLPCSWDYRQIHSQFFLWDTVLLTLPLTHSMLASSHNSPMSASLPSARDYTQEPSCPVMNILYE